MWKESDKESARKWLALSLEKMVLAQRQVALNDQEWEIERVDVMYAFDGLASEGASNNW